MNGDVVSSDEIVRKLMFVATGQLSHVYNGECPDPISPTSRDRNCPACAILMAADAIVGDGNRPARV